MWVYQQSTGNLYLDDVLKGVGYSGHGVGFNNPSAESLHGIGPIPSTLYTIQPWEAHHTHLGPCVAELLPVDSKSVFSRSEFFIHGDTRVMNHTASDGCIILSLNLRETIRDSGDNQLKVIT